MGSIKVTPISDLLSRRRPISATASLTHHRTTTLPTTSTTRNSNPKPPSKILNSLLEPSIIIGTLSLPTNHASPPHSSFSLSDDSATICCDVIDFDFSMIGRKIQVLSWNYIPFKKCGGLLEIIDWKFLDYSHSAIIDSFPLCFSDVGKFNESKAKYSVNGVVQSVSPVVIVPCSGDRTAGVAENVQGFVVEIVDCDHLDEGEDRGRTDFIYLSGAVSCWHPAFLRLVGKGISLSRLVKKVVYVGREEGMLMYVTSEGTQLSFMKLKEKVLPCRKRKRNVDERGELGVYVGVVKGVFMQGMVVELDEEVWLLMTSESLVLPHSVRVGAILSVRNVHFMNLKFGWGKVLVLGACSKTNIGIMSFAPLETRCSLVSQSESLLRKFINSLDFPARLWVLLVVQCFRRKFSQVLSEKVILGTKHNEGLVQTYARSVLPSSVSQAHRGMFMDFCKHESYGMGGNLCYGSVSLAVPFSNFLLNCDRIWIKSLLKMKSGLKIFDECSLDEHPSQENEFSDQPIRRILRSKDIGVSLVGSLKISKATGRLEFTDATGSIDSVIPDLPSAWNMNAIYEVTDYSIVLEGRRELWSEMWILDADLFSCSSIFRSVVLERRSKLTVYVHFPWSNVSCKHNPIYHCPRSRDTSADIDHSSFHLISVCHKYPLQQQFHGDLFTSSNCHLFAEVVVLPWVLNVSPFIKAACPEKASEGEPQSCALNGFAIKRCKTLNSSNCIKDLELCSSSEVFGKESCGESTNFNSLPHKRRSVHNFCSDYPVQIPCTASFRGLDGPSVAFSGVLYSSEDVDISDKLHITSLRKLLLEFNSDYMFKLMHIGHYYIMKHVAGKCFCDSDRNYGGRVFIDMETRLRSLSFNYEVVRTISGTSNDTSSGSCSILQNLWRGYSQNVLVFHAGSAANCGSFFDVTLHIAADRIGPLDVCLKALSESLTSLPASLANIKLIGQQVGCRSSVLGLVQNQGTHSRSSLPEGHLISLRGIVMSIQHNCCVSGDGTVDDIHLLKFSKGWKSLICLHVLTEGHVLQISGCLSKHEYPVGLAPGADVTFLRILALSEQHRLILTPVSFITVNSVKDLSPDIYSCSSVHGEAVVTCSIWDIFLNHTCELKKLQCRVVGVHIVILERRKNLDKLLSCSNSRTTIVNIPVAGFILDDGSSHCFCWASGERAETFLRLHEEFPQAKSGSRKQRSKYVAGGMSYSTLSSQLSNILKRHGRVTIKTLGSIHDNLFQNCHVSVSSGCIFGTQDESLLKLMIFNACSSNSWSVIGHVMDSKGVNAVEKYLLEEQMTIHPLPNVWVRDVSLVDTLTEARALFQEL